MQMKINTRLTALQCAQTLMSTPGYHDANPAFMVPGPDGTTAVPVNNSGKVDHITLLAIAGDIENYIIGDLQEEARKAIEEAKNPRPKILQVRP